MIKERHGVAGAIKISNAYADTQSVLVTDRDGFVELSLTACAFPAGLTPDEADFIARWLSNSAARVRVKTKAAK